MADVSAGVSAVVSKLGTLLQEESKLSQGVRKDIMFIIEELKAMQDFLTTVTEVPGLEGSSLRKLREVSYDLEDFVEGVMIRVRWEPGMTAAHGCSTIIQSTKDFVAKVKIRRQMAMQVQDLKRQVVELSVRLRSCRTDASATVLLEESPRPPATDAEVSGLVGVDGPRDELAKLLLTEEEPESAARLKVISIFGIGGVGKTTLAWEVYRTTQAYFDCGAWVPVSRRPKKENILMGILRQIEEPQSSNACKGERDLIRRIKESLQHKRYILVLDDIWSTGTWEIIKSALPMNSFGSRVITTTHINNVAESCCSNSNDRVYSIKPLSMKDSRMLFLRRIFGPVSSCPPDLAEVSDNILKKCSGLPLAITTISGLLAHKPFTRSIWENVCNSIAAPESIEGMRRILSLNYYDLPQHLKICFLYLSTFPEDCVIDRDRIVWSWMAEGFILESHGRNLFEIGEGYLNELARRNVIQPAHGSYDDELDGYLIHDMMLDLITCVSSQENIVTLLYDGMSPYLSHRKIRRLSIINVNEENYVLQTMTTCHIRSLYVFGDVGVELSFKQLTFLRVLDLQGCKDLKNNHLEEIAGLIHLRSLSIRETPISELPDQIGQLQYLTMLDLRGTAVRELPMSFMQLQKLARLHCDKMKFPEWIGKMAALSCLSQFHILQSKIPAIDGLGDLSELRELVIWWFPDKEFNNIKSYEHTVLSLYRLNKLQSLCIYGADTSVDLLDYLHHPLCQLHRIQLNRSCYLSRIPTWFRSLPSLTYLRIDVKKVKNEDLQLFSELPSLQHLCLSSKVLPTEKLVISSKGFAVLKEFHLHFGRTDIDFEPQAMQKLEKLLLSFHVIPEQTCSLYTSIDKFMCLKKVDIEINGRGAAVLELFKAAEVAIKKAADGHPNHPIVNIVTTGNFNDNAAKKGKQKEQKMELVKDHYSK